MVTIDVTELTAEQREQVLARDEGHFMDLKSCDVAPSKLSRAVSAFANAGGGELYVGIDERTVGMRRVREWRGFETPEAANGHIQLFERLFPLGQYFTYTYLRAPDVPGLVLFVTIHKTRDVVVASDEIAYIRRSAQNLPCKTAEELRRLQLDKGVASFEQETVSAPQETLTDSPILRRFLDHVIPTAQPETWLRKQLLIRRQSPTVAGILLFAEVPQAALPKRCGIKVFRYRTREAEGTRDTLVYDPVTVEGCLYDQIHEAVGITTSLVEEIPKLGEEGLQEVAYPPEALHEILTNAVLHRDYSIPTDVQVRVFDNRVEIQSPGRLPGHVTRENILREQFARNGTLVRIINKFPNPPNKDVGEGLNTAFLAMSRLRLKPPTIDETENSVLVTLRHEPLASAEAMILEYLETHDEITNREARSLTGIALSDTIKATFRRLRNRGILEAVPDRRNRAAAWRLVSKRSR